MIDEERHPVDVLADEFAQRLRHGERPSIEEYADRYPDHADLIRAVFPSVAAVERVAHQDSQTSAPAHPGSPGAHEAYGDFEIVRQIGAGGMGVVYEAIQRSLQRRVALKVMNDSTSAKEKHRVRFRREAEAAASLHHTNIVPIFGIGEDHGLQYYAMQLIAGATLQEVIECLKATRDSGQGLEANGTSLAYEGARQLMHSSGEQSSLRFETNPSGLISTQVPGATLAQATKVSSGTRDLSSTRALENIEIATELSLDNAPIREFAPSRHYYRNVARIIASAADALDYAHHAGVLHRDIKPANLLLDQEGTLWITDFGLARREDIEGQTQTGELLGTLQYMAPEQIRGVGDQRMDIYSLGLTLFELLTLQYGLESPRSRLIDPLGHSQVRFSRSMQRRIPRDLQTIVLKACALAPDDRYQRAADVEQDLRRFLEDRPIQARRASPVEQLSRWARRNPLLSMLTALSFGLLLTIAGLLALWNRQQQSTLARLSQEYDRAESNLREKTQALNRAETEQTRAEKNLQMAIEAFDQIMTNIGARGRLLSPPDLVDEETPEFVDAYLTDADVELLQSLAKFFDRFAEENTTDLRIETAIARRRVGEIQHRIGKFDDATQSLNRAIADFASIRRADPNATQSVLEEIAAREELILILGKRGQLPRANALFVETRQLIESNPAVAGSSQGQFALAKLLANMVNVGPRLAPERRRRGPFASSNRTPLPIAIPANQQARLKRESELNSESLSILERLVKDDPSQSAFQLALARACKDQVRIRIALGEIQGAESSLRQAIAIMESLLKSHPASASYRHELADILSMNVAFRDEDSQRSLQALELCETLVKEHPNAPQYLALKASVLSRIASLGSPSENRWEKSLQRLSEAIEIQSDLARRFPDVPLYAITLVQYHLQQSEVYFALRRPEKARESITNAAAIAETMQEKGVSQPLVKSFLDRIRERRANLEEKKNE
jgi:eukaryotic-like serine/threonine-protein kinase